METEGVSNTASRGKDVGVDDTDGGILRVECYSHQDQISLKAFELGRFQRKLSKSGELHIAKFLYHEYFSRIHVYMRYCSVYCNELMMSEFLR